MSKYSTWNFRIIRENVPDSNEVTYTFREVYYDSEMNPTAFTENPIKPIAYGNEDNPKESLRWQVEKMMAALDKQILIAETFPEEIPKTEYSNRAVI